MVSAPPPITMGEGWWLNMKICRNFVVKKLFLHLWQDKLVGIIQKVGSLGGERLKVIEKQLKTNRGMGRGPSMCLCSRFLKKRLRFPK